MLPLLVKIMFSPAHASSGGMVGKLQAELDERKELEELEEQDKLDETQAERLAKLRAQDVQDHLVDELTRTSNTGTGV